MKRTVGIFAVIVAALFAVSCGRGGRIIPADRLSRIYADIFVLDQALSQELSPKGADTLLVYEPIFNMYGYTTVDFIATVDHYLNDADAFSAIMKTTSLILSERQNYLRKAEDAEKERERISAQYPRFEADALTPFADTIALRYTPFVSTVEYKEYPGIKNQKNVSVVRKIRNED